MSKNHFLKFAVLFVAMLLLGTISMWAQATRTWVSGVGDDANPCSRTAPCKTFAGAISKTGVGGEIDVLDPGGFGAVTITKSITIDGSEGQVGSILAAGTNGIVVNAGSTATVTLRNLSINGAGGSGSPGMNGIRGLAFGTLHIDHCRIFGFSNDGIDIEVGGPAAVDVIDTISQDAAQYALYASSASGKVTVTIDRSRFVGSNYGVRASSNSLISVRDSEASENVYGFVAQGGGGPMALNLVNSTAANNTMAGIWAGGLNSNSTIRMSGVAVFDNGTALQIGVHGVIASFGNNYITGTGAPSVQLSPQ